MLEKESEGVEEVKQEVKEDRVNTDEDLTNIVQNIMNKV